MHFFPEKSFSRPLTIFQKGQARSDPSPFPPFPPLSFCASPGGAQRKRMLGERGGRGRGEFCCTKLCRGNVRTISLTRSFLLCLSFPLSPLLFLSFFLVVCLSFPLTYLLRVHFAALTCFLNTQEFRGGIRWDRGLELVPFSASLCGQL